VYSDVTAPGRESHSLFNAEPRGNRKNSPGFALKIPWPKRGIYSASLVERTLLCRENFAFI